MSVFRLLRNAFRKPAPEAMEAKRKGQIQAPESLRAGGADS